MPSNSSRDELVDFQFPRGVDHRGFLNHHVSFQLIPGWVGIVPSPPLVSFQLHRAVIIAAPPTKISSISLKCILFTLSFNYLGHASSLVSTLLFPTPPLLTPPRRSWWSWFPTPPIQLHSTLRTVIPPLLMAACVSPSLAWIIHLYKYTVQYMSHDSPSGTRPLLGSSLCFTNSVYRPCGTGGSHVPAIKPRWCDTNSAQCCSISGLALVSIFIWVWNTCRTFSNACILALASGLGLSGLGTPSGTWPVFPKKIARVD